MNREKTYTNIGVMLGIGIGFGIGYGASSLLARAKTDDELGFLFLFVYLPVMIIAAIATGKKTKGWLAGVVCGIGLVICLPVAVTLGISEFEVYSGGGILLEPIRFTSLFPLVLGIPFAGFGAINGYYIGSLIGKKADERAHAELERRQQKRERFEQKKTEIIRMIDEVLSGKKKRETYPRRTAREQGEKRHSGIMDERSNTTRAPVWSEGEFQLLLDNPELSDKELSLKLPRRTYGAIGIVRAGIHSFHRGGNVSMLSKMMLRYLERRSGSLTCPICKRNF